MKKYLALIIALALFSCEGNKEIQLPKANKTIVADVQEHSPIYIFFKIEGKDTIADVNRKNSIVSTNWIFNIDKRLPLRLVIPELIKLQAKKDGSIHKNEAAENFFSYANDVKKTMAFLPFTKVKYTLDKPKTGLIVYFAKNKKVVVNGIEVKKEELKNYLNQLQNQKSYKINFCIDKKCSYDDYLKILVFSEELNAFTNKLIEFDRQKQFVY
jgi:biopolymer transport protein ExbD